MNKKDLLGIALLVSCVGLAVDTVAYSSEHEWGEHGEGYFRAAADVPPVKNERYRSECGACHFAYQPGWLPARSWRAMMGSLDDHFGENAELDDATRTAITEYLVAGAADTVPNRQSRRILRSLGENDAPLRISELRYIRHEHDEIPQRLIADNPKVRSRSACQACHTQAEEGIFNEHGVNIPGHGRWDDD